MVDQITDKEWNRLYNRSQAETSADASSIKDWLTFWDTGTHEIKDGRTETGKQRFKTVTPKRISAGTENLAEELALPTERRNEILDGRERATTRNHFNELLEKAERFQKEIRIPDARQEFREQSSEIEEVIRFDEEVTGRLQRARSEKSIRRIKTEAEIKQTVEEAEEKLDGFLEDRERTYRKTLREIFTMSEAELNRLDIDREELGNKFANSLERAVRDRGDELAKMQNM